ncbi:hypothetical protein AURDEDRAFT_179272 [Auricularia subglabra TFB-10046 SS5]|nr:hypothetical protein AURDEDRAFT_179272 [Auricularia subglabra TFB-10046 SS5]
MGFLTARRTVTSSCSAKTSVPHALRVLQDPLKIIHLNPLVISSCQDERDNALWHITDRFMVACVPATTTYTARLTLVQDGIDFETHASGVHIANRWRVKAKSEAEVEIVEEAVVETSVFLIAFVKGKLKASHATMLEAISKLLDEKAPPDIKIETLKA